MTYEEFSFIIVIQKGESMIVKPRAENFQKITLYVLIPECVECRKRIEKMIMEFGYWESVDIGYPFLEGSTVELGYIEGKYPNVNYWELALEAKKLLNQRGYRVI